MIRESILSYTLYPEGPFDGQDMEIPNDLGIYIAFSARQSESFYRVTKLLYIGKTEDNNPGRGLAGRISDHVNHDHELWRTHFHIPSEDKIIYFCISIDNDSSQLIAKLEAALINYFKPQANTDYKTKIPLNLKLIKYIRMVWPRFMGTNLINTLKLTYSY